MTELSCQVCFLDYGEDRLPKILDCGHSLCKKCLIAVLQTCLTCPQCREEIITYDDESLFPTSYDFVSLMEKYRKQNMTKEEFSVQYVVPLKEQLLGRMKTIEDLIQKFSEQEKLLKTELDDIKTDLETLKDIESIPENFELVNATRRINCLKMKMLNRPPIPNFNFLNTVDPSFRLDGYENEADFLYEIYRRVTGGENLYSFLRVDDIIKFGKVECSGRKLCFYSLSLNKEEIQENSSFIKFQDVKTCTYSSTFQAFLKVVFNKRGLHDLVTIDLTDSSMVPQFVKLCTGECGPTYRGSAYCQKDYVQNKFQGLLYAGNSMHNVTETGQFDYEVSGRVSTFFKKDECIVYINDDKNKLSIVKMLADANYTNVIGKVVSPCDLLESIPREQMPYTIIKDCGVAILLK